METAKRMRRRTLVSCLAGVLFACLIAVCLVAAQSSKAAAQAVEIGADTSQGVLAVTANLVEGELLSVEVMGPGSKLVVDEDVASSSFTWAPGAGEADGLYRYEIQVVDKATGNMIGRTAGSFTVKGGDIMAPREITPVKKNIRQGMLYKAWQHLAAAMNWVTDFLVPNAQAADVNIEDPSPEILFDDTDDEDATPSYDWILRTSGGTSDNDTNNYFIISGYGELGTGCAEVPIIRIDHNGTCEAGSSPVNSLVANANGDLRLADGRMFFDRSASRLGINNTAPSYMIDAVGSSEIMLRQSTLATARSIAMRNDGAATDLEARNADLWIRADLPAPAKNIYMLSNRIGVGTTAPFYKFAVNGEGSNRSTLHFTNTGADVGGWLTSVAANNFFVSSGAMWDTAAGGWVQKSPDGLAVMAGSGPSGYRVMTRFGCPVDTACSLPITRMAIDYVGNVGFGIPLPAHPLHMASGAHVTAGGIWMNASSRKYKDHIQELALGDALKTIRNLNPVTFSYKAEPTEKHVGFIAEDVPDLVATKDREGLSPMDIVAVMTKVVQEQQGMIEKQQEMIEKLNARLEDLERRLR